MKNPISLLAALALVPVISSCSTEPSFGDRLISEGEGSRALGEKWNKGTALVTEGEAQKKKGRRMIDEGEGLISKGTKNIERGQELKTTAEQSASPGL